MPQRKLLSMEVLTSRSHALSTPRQPGAAAECKENTVTVTVASLSMSVKQSRDISLTLSEHLKLA